MSGIYQTAVVNCFNLSSCRFNEDGDEVNGTDSEKPKQEKMNGVVNGDVKESSEAVKTETKETVNGEVDSAATAANEPKEEAPSSSPEGSEKENKDTNGALSAPKPIPPPVSDIKGKGKGKGKGKSSKLMAVAVADAETEGAVEETPAAAAFVEKKKKSADEIYSSLLKTAPESGDEDSDDSEDQVMKNSAKSSRDIYSGHFPLPLERGDIFVQIEKQGRI